MNSGIYTESWILPDLLDMEVTFDEIDDVQLADVRCVLGQILLSPSAETGYSFEQRLTIRARLHFGADDEDELYALSLHVGSAPHE